MGEESKTQNPGDSQMLWVKYLLDRYGPLTVGLAVSLWWVGQNVAVPIVNRHVKFLDEEIDLRKADGMQRIKEEETRREMVQVLDGLRVTNKGIKATNDSILEETKRNGDKLESLNTARISPETPTPIRRPRTHE